MTRSVLGPDVLWCGNCHGTGDDGLGLMSNGAPCDACEGRGWHKLDPNAKTMTLAEVLEFLNIKDEEMKDIPPAEGKLTLMQAPPQPEYEWCMGDWSFVFRPLGKMPNRFHRFMLRLVFGIWMRPIKKD